MRHGIDAYFDDLRRDRRRVAGMGSAVAIVFLLAEIAASGRGFVEALNDPRRFGFEGPEEFVRRILLEDVSDVIQPGANRATVVPIELRSGGARRHETPRHGETPAAPKTGEGPGKDELNLESRMRALSLKGPVVRSEELVVEKLVRPDYPDEARDKDIEGLVEMVALVDTTGSVLEVHIIGGSGQPLLERAATDAVLQCIYRPYRLHDYAQRVWAYYRISFSLY